MADVSQGPVSSLPGSRRAAPDGAHCDDHPDRAAIARIQGETDSFGCEYLDVCEECLQQITEHESSEEARTGRCDWCKRGVTDLRPARDYDEGMAGPVYRVCGDCIRRRNEEAREELEERGYFADEEWD